jgi:hypothetical protein
MATTIPKPIATANTSSVIAATLTLSRISRTQFDIVALQLRRGAEVPEVRDRGSESARQPRCVGAEFSNIEEALATIFGPNLAEGAALAIFCVNSV